MRKAIPEKMEKTEKEDNPDRHPAIETLSDQFIVAQLLSCRKRKSERNCWKQVCCVYGLQQLMKSDIATCCSKNEVDDRRTLSERKICVLQRNFSQSCAFLIALVIFSCSLGYQSMPRNCQRSWNKKRGREQHIASAGMKKRRTLLYCNFSFQVFGPSRSSTDQMSSQC